MAKWLYPKSGEVASLFFTHTRKLQQGWFRSSAGYEAGKPQVFMPMQLPHNHIHITIRYFENGQAPHIR